MPEYVFFAVLAASLFAALSLAQKLTVRFSIPDQGALLFYLFLIQAAFAPIIWFFHPIQSPGKVWPFLLAQAAINLGANALYYYSLYRADISILGSLWPLKNVFNVFWGFLLFGETLAFTSYGWIALCIAGAILVAFNEKMRLKSFLQPAILLLVLTFFLFSASDVLIKLCLQSLDPWNQRAWSMLLCGAFPLFLLASAGKKLEKLKLSLPQFGSVFCINLFMMLGTVAITQAFLAPNAFTIASILAMLDAPFLFGGLLLLTLWKGRILEDNPLHVYLVRIVGIAILSVSALFLIEGPNILLASLLCAAILLFATLARQVRNTVQDAPCEAVGEELEGLPLV